MSKEPNMLCGSSLQVVKWIIDVRQSLVGAGGRLIDLGWALHAQNCCTHALAFGKPLFPIDPTREPAMLRSTPHFSAYFTNQ